MCKKTLFKTVIISGILCSVIGTAGCGGNFKEAGFKPIYFPWQMEGDWLKKDLKYLEETDTGLWSGIYTDKISTVKKLGKSVNTVGWFENFGSYSEEKVSLCLDEGKYNAFITLQPKYDGKELSCEEILSGDYDNVIINYLKHLSSEGRVKHEILIRFAHEMEIREDYVPWYAWQEKPEKADIYINMWRHVISLGREYAPNVKWVWSPNRHSELSAKYYPGDEYVDYIGLTMNNFRNDTPQDFKIFFEERGTREYMETYNKPLFFSEVAIMGSEEEQANYIKTIFDFLSENKNRYKGAIMFDFDVIERNGREFKFTDNELSFDSYKTNSGDYLSSKSKGD